MAQTSTVILDFGSLNDCCGLADSLPFGEVIEVGDPTGTLALTDSAGSGAAGDQIFDAGSGATLQWGNVAGWNNAPAAGDTTTNAGFDYIRHVADSNPAAGAGNAASTFTLTTANASDIVSIDFIAGDSRDANISVDGGASFTNIPVYVPGTSGWTNVLTTTAGSVAGLFEEGVVEGGDPNQEGNIGAARITITAAPAVVPEPSSLALLGMGAFAFGLRRRR